MDIKQIIKQAQDKNTSSEILAQLAISKDKITRQYIASNPNTPIKLLKKLSQEFPEEIMSNPVFDLLLIEESDNAWIKLTLAQSSTTPIETLVKLSKCDDYGIRAAVAGNSITPLSVLDSLLARADSKRFPARIFGVIAQNPNTTAEMLDKIVRAGGGFCVPVYDAILENPKVSIATLERLANHQSVSIEDKVFKHPKITENFLKRLSFSSYSNVREVVAEHQKTSYSAIYRLTKDSSERVRLKIAQRQSITREIIEILAQDSSEMIRACIANHKYLPPKIISNLAQDSSEAVRACVANHKHLPAKTISNLADDSSDEVRYQITSRKNLPPEIISNLAQDNCENVRRQIACHQDIAEHITNALANDSSQEVRYHIALNRDISVKIANKLAQDSSETVRCQVACRQNISDATANILAQDSSEKVRCQIAGNRFISEKIANILARDNSEYVRRQLVINHYSHEFTHPKLLINQNVSTRTLEILLKKSQESNYSQLPHDIDLNSPDLKFSQDYPITAIYDLETRRDIARHPQATFEILDRLKSDRYDCIRQAVASNKNNLYPEIIIDLANDSAAIVRCAIARNIKSHDFTLAALSSEKNNLYTFEGILNKLINDNETVRCAVAQNPNALESFLDKLANDNSKKVRQAVAKNFNSSSKILENLKNDDSFIVSYAVANNPNASLNTLKELSNSVHDNIAIKAKLNLAEKQKLIQRASNENTSPAALDELAKSRSKIVRQYVASNPNTPIKTLEILSKEFPEEIAANPVFALLVLENPLNPFVKLSLARSTTTSEETLVKLYHSHRQYKIKESCKILIAIANNSRASEEFRKQLKFEIMSFYGGGIEYNYTL